MARSRFRRAAAGARVMPLALLALLTAGELGCARGRPAPRPPDLPTAMPSEEEAARTAPGAPAALPEEGRPPEKGKPPVEGKPPAGGKAPGEGMPAPPLVIGPSGTIAEAPAPTGDPLAPSAADSLLTPEPENARPGFSVQLLATVDARLAQQRSQEYRELFGLPVYVRLENSLYKIRVGDCRTREDAEALRRRALALGYDGAFIVEARIAPE